MYLLFLISRNADALVESQEKLIPGEIIELAEKRQKARENKDWAESDRIRDEIVTKGFSIKDTKNGYELT